MKQIIAAVVAACAVAIVTGDYALGVQTPYDPLAATGEAAAPVDLAIHDAERDREIAIRVFLPQAEAGGAPGPAPLVMFSHGLGGSRENSPYLGRHWAARGFAVVYLQHAGSDEGVWRGKRLPERMASMKAAMTGSNLQARAADVHAALDQLAAWNGATEHPLARRLDLQRVGMCGHSFGAATTQAVSGQKFPVVGAGQTDPRIRAAVLFSPSAPRRSMAAADAFGEVAIPWLAMTGTRDVAPVGEQTVESRLQVYASLPPGSKYEVVLEGAQHSAFGDRVLMGEQLERNPNHHRAILALSTAFWDAYLREDAAARAWLDGEGPRGVLEEKDRWQRK